MIDTVHDFAVERRIGADGHRAVQNGDFFNMRQFLADFLIWKRPEKMDAEQSHFFSLFPELVDNLSSRSRGRTQNHDRLFGVVQPVRIEHLIIPAGRFSKLAADFFIFAFYLGKSFFLIEFEFKICVLQSQRSQAYRVFQIQKIFFRRIFTHKLLSGFIVQNLDPFGRMRSMETVHHSDDRISGFFRQLKTDESQVICLLGVFRKDLNPTAVANRHYIAVFPMDIKRSGKCPRAHIHKRRQTKSGSDIENFMHQSQALGTGGCHGPGSRSLRPHDRAHSTVLAFHLDDFRFHFAVRLHFGESLDDRGLRSYRINRHHVRFHLSQGFGCGGSSG